MEFHENYQHKGTDFDTFVDMIRVRESESDDDSDSDYDFWEDALNEFEPLVGSSSFTRSMAAVTQDTT